MRGAEAGQGVLFSLVSLEQRIPRDHPLRAMKALIEPILRDWSPQFATLYPDGGRPSVPPEQLLRALLLQVLYTVRSERQLIEQLDYNLLFRWFVGMDLDSPVWHATTFTKNRARLLEGHIAEAFLSAVRDAAAARGLLSHEHFTVDGTLLDACAGQKSFVRKDGTSPPPADDDPGNPTVHFHGERDRGGTRGTRRARVATGRARSGLRRMWPTRRCQSWMGARRGTPGITRVSGGASGSKRRLGGARRSACSGNGGIAGAGSSTGSSLSRWRRTTWCDGGRWRRWG